MIVLDVAFHLWTAYFVAISNTTHICHAVDHCIHSADVRGIANMFGCYVMLWCYAMCDVDD